MTIDQTLAIYGAVCLLATALSPLFPVDSRPAKILNWIGSQTRGLRSAAPKD